MVSITDDRRGVSRRTLAKGAAWAAPGIVMVGAAPHAAASPSETIPSQFSSWGGTYGGVKCGSSSCSNGQNKYTWNIDNSSGISYHGVLFPQATAGQTYSNVVNVYYLPFSSGSVTSSSGASGSYPRWSMLAPSGGATILGPNGATYYPWITTFVSNSAGTPASVTVTASQIDSNGIFHLQPDYQFSVSSSCTSFSGPEWVSHAYSAYLNGSPLLCTTSVNNNYCGSSSNYNGTGNGDNKWRNNGWVGPLTDSCGSGGGGGRAESKSVQAQTADPTAPSATGTASSESKSTPKPSSVASHADTPVVTHAVI